MLAVLRVQKAALKGKFCKLLAVWRVQTAALKDCQMQTISRLLKAASEGKACFVVLSSLEVAEGSTERHIPQLQAVLKVQKAASEGSGGFVS